MLNGVAPVILFRFPTITFGGGDQDVLEPGPDFVGPIEPLTDDSDTSIGQKILDKARGAGLPIPIYLDPDLTGLHVDSEDKNVDMDTQVQGKAIGGGVIVDQRGLNSSVTIHLLARKDSIILNALLSMIDMAFSRLVNIRYSVSYFHKNTSLFGGLIDGVSIIEHSDSELVTINLTITKVNQEVVGEVDFTEKISGETGDLPSQAAAGG